ncbi:MAG: membrane lipoprotein lipid attachment site-containing protein [Bacilli bacterium]|nr:membrane lipoprotein lipid attachment site-containing protein [Bacilli bacterium]
MKKIIVIILTLFLVSGCIKKDLASDVVKAYLNNYVNLTSDVKESLNKTISENNEFSDLNKKMYKKILLRQYKDLKYTILTEEYDRDKALITVNINVYDLNKADEAATNYLSTNLKEFYDNDDKFNNDKYINYKLNLMYESKDRVDYNIVFFLNKKKNKWVLEQPTDSDLEKIHGIYKSNN